MLDKIAMWIGYVIIITLGLALIGVLMWLIYFTYDYYLKKLLGWKNRQVREDIFYFIKHKKEIQNYIKSLSNSASQSAKAESLIGIKRVSDETPNLSKAQTSLNSDINHNMRFMLQEVKDE